MKKPPITQAEVDHILSDFAKKLYEERRSKILNKRTAQRLARQLKAKILAKEKV